LTEQGHVVDSVGSVEAFQDTFSTTDHLITIIDLGLPDGDGVELIEWLRKSGHQQGVIIISARVTTDDRIRGLLVGADSYLCKPFELAELSALVNSLVRRVEAGGVSPNWRVDIQQQLIIPPGHSPVRLTAQGMTVLSTIAKGKGKPVNRKTVIEALGGNFLNYDQRRLDTQIHQLRKAVLDATHLELPILTARNHGYIFGADIEFTPEDEAAQEVGSKSR
jgi:DNA-binding response OmpR family regulator